MGNYTEYFDRIGYHPTYHLGDRVFGRYQKIPFIGSVGNDTIINHTEGARISIHLDLPMKTKDGFKSVIVVKHKDIKKLVSY
jgi:hypothetical protein